MLGSGRTQRLRVTVLDIAEELSKLEDNAGTMKREQVTRELWHVLDLLQMSAMLDEARGKDVPL